MEMAGETGGAAKLVTGKFVTGTNFPNAADGGRLGLVLLTSLAAGGRFEQGHDRGQRRPSRSADCGNWWLSRISGRKLVAVTNFGAGAQAGAGLGAGPGAPDAGL
ncbi:MAG TPA: hypothetical protein PK313_14655, partial [Myxococcota bacterium]|nr:hypothetical protein [Myxococcota bacterium]